jgi:hypothetical protein
MYIHLPNIMNPMYIQHLVIGIFLPIQDILGICYQITIVILIILILSW